jgi:hypothetical protein
VTACNTSGSIPAVSRRQTRRSTLQPYGSCFAGIATQLDATCTCQTCPLNLLEIREKPACRFRTLISEKASDSRVAGRCRSSLHLAWLSSFRVNGFQLSHVIQPLDISCFEPLKVSHSCQAENPMRSRINHITKLEFLPCFKAAVDAAITKNNILRGFRDAGLVTHDAECCGAKGQPFAPLNRSYLNRHTEVLMSKLDVRLRTPSPLTVDGAPWQSQTTNQYPRIWVAIETSS